MSFFSVSTYPCSNKVLTMKNWEAEKLLTLYKILI